MQMIYATELKFAERKDDVKRRLEVLRQERDMER